MGRIGLFVFFLAVLLNGDLLNTFNSYQKEERLLINSIMSKAKNLTDVKSAIDIVNKNFNSISDATKKKFQELNLIKKKLESLKQANLMDSFSYNFYKKKLEEKKKEIEKNLKKMAQLKDTLTNFNKINYNVLNNKISYRDAVGGYIKLLQIRIKLLTIELQKYNSLLSLLKYSFIKVSNQLFQMKKIKKMETY
jgi:predicted nuclease with TOPRIM domain